jgi:hypothetical protein
LFKKCFLIFYNFTKRVLKYDIHKVNNIPFNIIIDEWNGFFFFFSLASLFLSSIYYLHWLLVSVVFALRGFCSNFFLRFINICILFIHKFTALFINELLRGNQIDFQTSNASSFKFWRLIEMKLLVSKWNDKSKLFRRNFHDYLMLKAITSAIRKD